MDKEILDFSAKLAWPLVVLIGILILGPGGVLQKIIGELAEKLFRITDAVNEFKSTANDFHRTQNQLKESTQWVKTFEDQLLSISLKIESINSVTQQSAILQGNRTLERSVDQDNSAGADSSNTEELSTEAMFANIRSEWDILIEKLRDRVGPDQFDARSVGQMASKLVDKRRNNPITAAQAELFDSLQSQMKRFNRLQSTKDEWLTLETYHAFMRGIDQAKSTI